MGGETRCLSGSARLCRGLSPRGRGNLLHDRHQRLERRSIPAWAGKPCRSRRAATRTAVYPRVGGETPWRPGSWSSARGLSPRGRGNRQPSAQFIASARSIPAWAGKPPRPPRDRSAPEVYPRVGGETGSSPIVAHRYNGLSPRGRGNQPGDREPGHQDGSIPAWAGKPVHVVAAFAMFWVYPRVGGETVRRLISSPISAGLSPRGRGNPAARCSDRPCGRSIPAWAGKPSCAMLRSPLRQVYPRVGGETSRDLMPSASPGGLSPRGRGNPLVRRDPAAQRGSIPAWAGKPLR